MSQTAISQKYELIGWLGFTLIIGAYLLITLHFVQATSGLYHLLNLCGAVCMVMTAKNKGAKPLFWLNLVWALIAVVGLWQAGISG